MSDTYEQQLDRSERERKRLLEWHRARAREAQARDQEAEQLLADVALAAINAANRPRLQTTAPAMSPAPVPAATRRAVVEQAREQKIARLRRSLDADTLRTVDQIIEARRLRLDDAARRRDQHARRTLARR